MPRIFDNIELELLPALRAALEVAGRYDFCVGYFNLRGWKAIDDLVEQWLGELSTPCRLHLGPCGPRYQKSNDLALVIAAPSCKIC